MALNIARSRGDQPAVDRLQRLLQPKGVVEHWFANGFDHPELVLYTDGSPNEPRLLSWGLVPTWFKDLGELARFRKQTLNARGETMFDKPAFRSAAEQRRAIVFVEGYYEHYHLGGKAYPFFIHLKGGAPFALAALWEEWVHPSGDALTTFSIANDLAKYFAIIPAAFVTTFPALAALNVMHLASPQSAILSAVIFNALIIIALIPLSLKGVKYRPESAASMLRRNIVVYGIGGIVAPFIGIKLIDMLLASAGLA